MTIKYLYIILFSFVVQVGISQHSFSDEKLQDFVQVYMSFKKEKKRNSYVDKKFFEIHNVSQKRYKEIANAALTKEQIDLKPNEEQLRLDLKRQNEIVRDSNRILLEKICLEYDLSTSLYSTILNRYKKDIQFQRLLKPHFDAYIKRLK